MLAIRNVIPFVAAISLFAGFITLGGCQSTPEPTPAATSGATMSGAGGGNGTFGSNPANAMHSNPSDTQPAEN